LFVTLPGMVRLWRGAAAVPLVAATLFFSASSSPARAAGKLRVSLIGDSVAASIASSSAARRALSGFDVAIDARVCRRTAMPACTWHGQSAPSVRQVVDATPGSLGDVAVIVSGYNDDARRFARDADAVLHDLVAAGVHQVVWLNLRTPPTLSPASQARQWSINASLAALDRASPVLRVARWNAYSAGHPDWFFDPIHLRSSGAVQLARFIAAQLRGLRAGLRPNLSSSSRYRCSASNVVGDRPGSLMSGVLAAGGPVVPRRAAVLLDTRPGPGDSYGRPLGAGRTVRVVVAGYGRVPLSATTAAVRVTAIQPCGSGQVLVGGCGLRATAVLAVRRGRTAALTVNVPTGAFGRICVTTNVQTDVQVVLHGWALPAPFPLLARA
jgi:hypothetical protein